VFLSVVRTRVFFATFWFLHSSKKTNNHLRLLINLATEASVQVGCGGLASLGEGLG